jgi:uncharacterized protein (TIGR02246 family)
MSAADELEIRGLVARYADAVNRRDAQAWGDTWADDGTWHVLGQTVTGREPLVKFWGGAMGFFAWVLQLVHSGEVQITGDTARTRFYLSEVGETQTGDRLYTVGVYEDELVKTDGAWRFQVRRFEHLYQSAPDLSGRVFPPLAPGPPE